MRQRIDATDDREFQHEILAQPGFAGASLKFVRRLSATHSQLLEYSVASRDKTKHILVKQLGATCDAERVTLQEFANLRTARSLVGRALARSIPEPLFTLPNKGILVTTKVLGVPLSEVLKRQANHLAAPFRMSAIFETAQRVGSWLRSFQRATAAEPVPYCSATYVEDLEERLAQLHDREFKSSLTGEILRQASRRSSLLEGRLILTAARHGDFIAQNILVKDDSVAVVDFEGFSERQPIYDDPGMFLAYLMVLGTRAPYSKRALDAARRGFLEGFLAAAPFDRALLNTYIAKGAVRIIADGASRRLGTPEILTERITRLFQD